MEQVRSCRSVNECSAPARMTATPTAKRVAFKSTATLRTYSPQHGDTSALYYGKQDYRGFKRDIKDLCLRSRELRHVRNAGALTLLSDDAATASNRHGDVVDSLRGLEHWLFVKRAQHKRWAQRTLLKYQGVLLSWPGMTSEGRHAALAAASASISVWSAAVAANTAQLDVMRAYTEEGDMLIGPRCIAKTNPLLSRKRQRPLDSGRGDESFKRRKEAQR